MMTSLALSFKRTPDQASSTGSIIEQTQSSAPAKSAPPSTPAPAPGTVPGQSTPIVPAPAQNSTPQK
jgi:hypothetical protein